MGLKTKKISYNTQNHKSQMRLGEEEDKKEGENNGI